MDATSCYSFKKVQTDFLFFSAYDDTTESIKQRFEQTYYMIYCSNQNALVIGIKGRKIEDHLNQIVLFYQGYLVKKTWNTQIRIKSFRRNN